MTDPWAPPRQPQPQPPPQPVGPPAWRRAVPGEVAVAVGLLAAGLVLGGLWALAAPALAERADPGETRVAVDGLLGLICLAAGLVTAAGLAVARGREPVVRLVAVLVGSTGGALLAAAVGLARGLELRAPGLALLWPLMVAVLTAVRLLVGLMASPEGPADVPARLR